MSTASAYLTVRGIDVDVIYKDIKNLHIGVYPPMGRVRVAAPRATRRRQIRLAVVQRLPWIKRQREQLQNAERQSEREMVTGETHYVWGERYRLEVVDARAGTTRRDRGQTALARHARTAPTPTAGERLLDAGTASSCKAAVPALIEKWEPIIGVEADRSSSGA